MIDDADPIDVAARTFATHRCARCGRDVERLGVRRITAGFRITVGCHGQKLTRDVRRHELEDSSKLQWFEALPKPSDVKLSARARALFDDVAAFEELLELRLVEMKQGMRRLTPRGREFAAVEESQS